ncbi:MAG TPA: hypothetical protein VFP88_00285 [Rhodanobacteraceae bacterium]|nr:hypothetical protein [Rhodanobacteraceae bacterium]
MSYFRAVAEREQAFTRCIMARERVRIAAGDVAQTYRAYPVPVLATTAIAGVMLAQFRVGRTLAMAGAQLVGGPASGLMKKLLSRL